MDLNELKKIHSEGKKIQYIFFWGHRPAPNGLITSSCFSQWWESKFKDDNGIIYKWAEQYMMAEKARLFKDETILKEIMKAQSPKECKDLGRKVKNFDKKIWDNNCRKIVEQGSYYKFSQNPDLKKFLLNTGNKILVEASPYDDIWGIKMKATDNGVENPNNWKGTNYLGFALMSTREKLK